MSIAIDTDLVTHVLIAGNWYRCEPGTFDLDSYEYVWSGMQGVTVAELEGLNQKRDRTEPYRDPVILHGGGQSGVCATGFVFTTPEGNHIAGPLTAIQAVWF